MNTEIRKIVREPFLVSRVASTLNGDEPRSKLACSGSDSKRRKPSVFSLWKWKLFRILILWSKQERSVASDCIRGALVSWMTWRAQEGSMLPTRTPFSDGVQIEISRVCNAMSSMAVNSFVGPTCLDLSIVMSQRKRKIVGMA
ncbi:MAG: hypothetical protein D6690_05645 [Nitrospirae bacterium]|nr:MAG: hypothetical protein D6690_05645 [Nitrospirota bacterium]